MRVVAVVAALLLSAPTVAGAADSPDVKFEKRFRTALALTPEKVRAKVDVKDDAMEVAATLTTRRAWQETGLNQILRRTDVYIRAFVDKKTGVVRPQIYVSVDYLGDWVFYGLVNYQSGGEVVSAEVDQLTRDVLACSYGSCRHLEVFAFKVDEGFLRQIAAAYRPDAPGLWRMRFKGKSGEEFDDALSYAEVAGLLEAVDAYRSAKQLTVAP